MRILKFTFFFIFVSALLGGLGFYFLFDSKPAPSNELYQVEIPSVKKIKQTISATGKLKLKDQVDVGSVVTGRVKAIHVEENDAVKEGQLLVEIDTGFGDTEVREAEGAYEKGLADKDFCEAIYLRKKQLYEDNFLSEAALQGAKCDYLKALADVKTLKATYEKKQIEFQNNQVYAPASGIVIHIDVAKGEKVTSDLDGGELLSLVPDIQTIEAELEISEKDIGQIQKGQAVQMVVDTYPNKVFTSTIHNIHFVAKDEDDKECVYLAKAYIDNPRLLLRPGMSVNATIDVASKDAALTVTSRAFLIKKEHLQDISEVLNLPIEAISDEGKEEVLRNHPDEHVLFIWTLCENCFKEVPVKMGITDNISFEIKSGLTGDEKLIVDVAEEDEMRKIYDKAYRKL